MGQGDPKRRNSHSGITGWIKGALNRWTKLELLSYLCVGSNPQSPQRDRCPRLANAVEIVFGWRYFPVHVDFKAMEIEKSMEDA